MGFRVQDQWKLGWWIALIPFALFSSLGARAGDDPFAHYRCYRASHVEPIHDKSYITSEAPRPSQLPHSTTEDEILSAPPESIADQFTKLVFSKKLISQSDPALDDLGLLVPNGGLCASTCGVHLLHSIFAYRGLATHDFIENSAKRIQDIVDSVWHQFQHDARMGLAFRQLEVALHVLGQRLRPQLYFHSTIEGFSTFWSESTAAEFMKGLNRSPEDIPIAAVQINGKKSHAIVILDVFPSIKRLSFWDPNRPTVTYDVAFKYVKLDGSRFPSIQIEMPSGYGDHPLLGRLLEVLQISASSSKSAHIEKLIDQAKTSFGKQVLVRREDGRQSLRAAMSIGSVNSSFPNGGIIFDFSLMGKKEYGTIAYENIVSIDEFDWNSVRTSWDDYVGKKVDITLKDYSNLDQFRDSLSGVTIDGYEPAHAGYFTPHGGVRITLPAGWSTTLPHQYIERMSFSHQ